MSLVSCCIVSRNKKVTRISEPIAKFILLKTWCREFSFTQGLIVQCMNFSYCSIQLLTLALVLAPSFCYPTPDRNATGKCHTLLTVCNLRHYENHQSVQNWHLVTEVGYNICIISRSWQCILDWGKLVTVLVQITLCKIIIPDLNIYYRVSTWECQDCQEYFT